MLVLPGARKKKEAHPKQPAEKAKKKLHRKEKIRLEKVLERKEKSAKVSVP